MTVRTRFAPSPTGFLAHRRLADRAVLLAVRAPPCRRSSSCASRTRISSAPPPRPSSRSWTAWNGPGSIHDEGPFFQTKRFDRYKDVIEELLAERQRLSLLLQQGGARADARAADCARREAALRRPLARAHRLARRASRRSCASRIRSTGEVVVDDVVHGRVVFQNTELDDLIIARSDGTPTYNFCVVVDDMDMQITHVIRGDDHLNNTPRQLNMLLALGQRPPVYAHLPMILGADGAKLSKRHGAVSVLQYRDEGFLPEAVLNYLVRLGWSHGDQEFFSRRGNGAAVRHRRCQ